MEAPGLTTPLPALEIPTVLSIDLTHLVSQLSEVNTRVDWDLLRTALPNGDGYGLSAMGNNSVLNLVNGPLRSRIACIHRCSRRHTNQPKQQETTVIE